MLPVITRLNGVAAFAVVIAAGCTAPAPGTGGATGDSATVSGSESAVAESATSDSARRPAPAGYRAVGTEPFWGLSISDDELRFSTPDTPEGLRFPPTSSRREADTLLWSGSADGTVLEARVWPGECSDHMSDSVYTHTAQVRIGGTTYDGCAAAVPDSASR